MATYKAPLRDIRFVLNEVLADLDPLPGDQEFNPETVDAVLDAAAQMAEEVLQPLNRSGDEEGSVLQNGVVRTPKGWKEAYEAFRKDGWVGMPCAVEDGGQGMPRLLHNVVKEILCSANLAFGMFPGLSNGAYAAIRAYGVAELKRAYLPKLASGEWTGTMCLTEPQCGTDLGLIRTKAVPKDDGSFAITGTKIFISCGDHDFTENIVHLVLAKLPEAPEGVRGISLFLVPKRLPMADGRPGVHNGVTTGALEHKMGIKASPTCVLNFENSVGWLVGGKHRGMSCMFTMMNEARLSVGIQGLGLAEVAYQNARDYAKERTQGRSVAGTKDAAKSADPILVHPEVRRNLLSIRSFVEGARAMGYWIGRLLDEAEKHPDPVRREAADELVQLLTPIVKAYMTDQGFASTVTAQQVYGGHGYIREHGVEQFVRDARIAQIYEGTNGIQALDLVGRKLPANLGRLLRRFFHPVDTFIQANASDPKLAEFVMPLAKAFAKLQQATAQLAERGLKDPEDAVSGATDYLRLFGHVVMGFLWCRMVKLAQAKIAAGGDGDGFYAAKVMTARFFIERVLPETDTLFRTVLAGRRTLMEMPAEAF
ncbi:MAG: acyl-CoA dehydrogenase [Alphaproteobacteria bacterium]|nr:acyl-CoA dehydrogenase [Alphaproteobacteria bacterium]